MLFRSVILGMDWLKANKAQIDCAKNSVTLFHSSGQIIYSPHESSSIQLYTLNANPLPSIENVPVVCDFPDVFSEELPGMPPDRAVEFVIELEPGTAPVSKYPYTEEKRNAEDVSEKIKGDTGSVPGCQRNSGWSGMSSVAT